MTKVKKKEKKVKKKEKKRKGVTLEELTVGVNNLLESGEITKGWERGLKRYEKREKKDRNDVFYWFGRAHCEGFLGKYEQARRSLNNALNLKPKDKSDLQMQKWIMIYIKGDQYHLNNCSIPGCEICHVIIKRGKKK